MLLQNEVTVVTWKEHEPELFSDQPDVLDTLGLKEVREKMTVEQNRMIQLKHNICCRLEGSFDDQDPEKEANRDPFDFNAAKVPDTSDHEREMMKTALSCSALRNPQYRECVKEYLEAVIPVVAEKTQKLQEEMDTLQLELESLQATYLQKISALRKELKAFQADVSNDVDRFYLTDTGSARAGGLIPCEQPDPGLWMICRKSFDVNDYLASIAEMIDQVERIPEKRDTLGAIKGRYHHPLRDGSGSASMMGGATITTDHGFINTGDDGLLKALKNMFSELNR